MSVADSEPRIDPAPAPAPAQRVRIPGFGEPAPMFAAASEVNPRFQFASLGGKWLVLLFFGSLGHPVMKAAHDRILARRGLFDDERAMFFGVTLDPADVGERGLRNRLPGVRYFYDFDRKVSALYGLATAEGFTPTAFLIDGGLRVAAAEPIDRLDLLLDQLDAHLRAERAAPPDECAPVLAIPRVLEPDYCRALIAHYHAVGGERSGFMREIDGMTVAIQDEGVKKRSDVHIRDPALVEHLRAAVSYRLFPAIRKAMFWQATRIERFIVACYTAEDGGFFRAHRDNTTAGTAHRRFAVSINLNDAFDGGDLRFPEFGMRTYRPPLGGAVVFSCSLLHEATPVTRGVRYATLPFLYDEEGRKIRDANLDKLAPPAPAVGSMPLRPEALAGTPDAG
jgi:predicted 2-oxoglutarate/Fe(II)-dependent dioxygenase YbiX